ncbi:restriction endonuclease subunit S [Streptomyces europaeiscabiei]|uniref:restriction endonuclease subunit S n=1 Tax=Streptomyces europaeiscabiei TaxID=146819 RepID=UPI0038F66129
MPLAEVLDFQEGPGIMARDFRSVGVPLIRLAGLKRGAPLLAGCDFLDDEQVSRRWDHFRLKQGDVLLSTSASLGEISTVDGTGVDAIAYTGIIRFRPKSSEVLSQFIPHALTAPSFKRQIEAMGVGSVIKHFGPTHLRQMTVCVPPAPEQQAIAEVLGALDDKIAVNEQIAATAYELAEALYIQDSAAEQGWRETVLSDTAKWMSGGTPTTSEASYWNGDIPWISAASLKSPWLDDSERKVTRLGAENGTRLVPAGTIIFVVRGMSLTSEFRVGLTQREVAFGQDCKALVPHPGIDPVVLLLALRSRTQEILGLVDTAGHGTGRLSTDRIARLRVRLPEGETATAFAETVRPLAQRASAVRRENRTLADLRDTLLPQLVTGKIRVKDAERVVEDAAS